MFNSPAPNPAPQLPSTLTTFTFLTSLVPELRLKIWQHACHPRTIEVRYSTDQDRCLSATPPPALLQVCHESRDEALRTYKLSFGTRSHPARIYFNPYRDTLYLPRHRLMGYDETLRDFHSFLLNPEILHEMKTVAIDHVDHEVKRPWESYNKAALLRSFSDLDQVVLVLCNDRSPSIRPANIEFVEPKEDTETLLSIWTDFRDSFEGEQKMLEDVCRAEGTEYVHWTLPKVMIRSKAVRDFIPLL